MAKPRRTKQLHPLGEPQNAITKQNIGSRAVDTYGGKVQLRWDAEAAVTGYGQMPYFIEFLKSAGLFDDWVADCPLDYRSPNAPAERGVLGTLLLSLLAGHRRYAHISSIRGDGVNPQLLGMGKVVSEDSARQAFQGADEKACRSWLREHLQRSYEALLEEPWTLGVDSSVKPLYGCQQVAQRGYNPGKPGRPSHVYPTYFVANLRLLLEVEMQPGNQTASSYAQPELWKFLDGLAPQQQPALLRGGYRLGDGADDAGR